VEWIDTAISVAVPRLPFLKPPARAEACEIVGERTPVVRSLRNGHKWTFRNVPLGRFRFPGSLGTLFPVWDFDLNPLPTSSSPNDPPVPKEVTEGGIFEMPLLCSKAVPSGKCCSLARSACRWTQTEAFSTHCPPTGCLVASTPGLEPGAQGSHSSHMCSQSTWRDGLWRMAWETPIMTLRTPGQ
jgi:hypothetical protein